MARIREPILIIPCPICLKNDWQVYGGKEYFCSTCEYKLDISRKPDFKYPDL